MRVLFMGGHELGALVLEHLIAEGFDLIGAVVTETDDAWYKGVDEAALRHGLPLFREKDINRPGFVQAVRGLRPDLLAVVNFDQILKRELLGIPSLGAVNTHASLLPKYRGRAPLNWAIINGETETGVTVHRVAEGIDTGDILIQRTIPIGLQDTIGDILEKVKTLYPIIVSDALRALQLGTAEPQSQDLSRGFYCGRRTAADGEIDWRKPAKQIYDLIRGVSRPYPGAYTYLGSQKIILWRGTLTDLGQASGDSQPGMVLQTDSEGFTVVTGDGLLRVLEWEPPVALMAGERLRPMADQ